MSVASGYIAVCLPEIPAGPLAIDLHFPMGDSGARKWIRVHAAGQELSPARRTQMNARGIRLFWIKASDEAAFVQSLVSSRPRASELAHCLLDACLNPEDKYWEELSLKASLEIAARWINRPGLALSPVWTELSQLARAQKLLSHAARVATYSVLFAMAFEHEDPLLLSDLAIAGFLHDVGAIELGFPLASSRAQEAIATSPEKWKTHPDASIRIIEKHAPEISERARLWISQHHERFGGGGYPLGLEGYKVNDIAQLLAAAELVDELASGIWDGIHRGFKGAIDSLENFDREKTFPQFFHPELLKAMLGWSKRTKPAAKSAAA